MPKRKSNVKLIPLITKARRLFRGGAILQAHQCTLQGVEIAKAKKDNRSLVEGLFLVSDYHSELDQTRDAISTIEEAISISSREGFLDLQNDGIRRRALMHLMQGQYNAAENAIGNVLHFALEHKLVHLEADCRAAKGLLLEARRERSKALVWLRLAMKLARASGHDWRESALYNDIGRIQADLHEYTVALDLLVQGEEFARSKGFRKHEMLILRTMGDIYRAAGDLTRAWDLYMEGRIRRGESSFDYLEFGPRFASISVEKGQYDSAETHCRRVIRVAADLGVWKPQLIAYFELGSCYSKCNQLLAAFESYLKLLKVAKGNYEYCLSYVRPALEQIALLLRMLHRDHLAERVESFNQRFKTFDDEGMYGVLQKESINANILGDLPNLVQDICNAKLGHYEAQGIRVNLDNGEVRAANKKGSKFLTKTQLEVFKFLFDNLGRPCTIKKIHDKYSGEEDVELRSLKQRVYVLISSIRKKGIPPHILQSSPKGHYKLVSR
jgi:tetratricopeptide (TPR) repeat protein